MHTFDHLITGIAEAQPEVFIVSLSDGYGPDWNGDPADRHAGEADGYGPDWNGDRLHRVPQTRSDSWHKV